jgi:hypothetical protein
MLAVATMPTAYIAFGELRTATGVTMHPMSESYDRLLAALRDGTAFVCLDVQPPRDAPIKQFVASLFEPAPGDQRPTRPQGQAVSVAVTPQQARELLAAGAEWKGPAHLRAEVLPD